MEHGIRTPCFIVKILSVLETDKGFNIVEGNMAEGKIGKQSSLAQCSGKGRGGRSVGTLSCRNLGTTSGEHPSS